MLVESDERGRIVHQGPTHDDAGMHGGAIDGALKQVLDEYRLVAVVEVDDSEDFVSKPAKPGLDIAPGVGWRGERPIASQPGLHPAGVELVQRMHSGAVLVRQEEGAERGVGVVE